MLKYIIVITIMSLLVACPAPQKIVAPPPVKKAAITHHDVQMPAWVFKPTSAPQMTVGISKVANRDTKTMLAAAQENAAINYTRNQESVNISCLMVQDVSSKYSDSQLIEKFERNFVANIPRLKKINKQLMILDYYTFQGFFIGLFGMGNTAKPAPDVSASPHTGTPDWYKPYLTNKNGVKKAYGYARAAYIHTAWEKAHTVARLQLARHLESVVSGELLSNDEKIAKLITIKTDKIVQNLHTVQTNIASVQKDNILFYDVWIEMQIEIK